MKGDSSDIKNGNRKTLNKDLKIKKGGFFLPVYVGGASFYREKAAEREACGVMVYSVLLQETQVFPR